MIYFRNTGLAILDSQAVIASNMQDGTKTDLLIQ